jgi:hypothetical protein
VVIKCLNFVVMFNFRSVYQTWDPQVDPVVVINKQYLTSRDDVIEHVEDLVFIILGRYFYVC